MSGGFSSRDCTAGHGGLPEWEGGGGEEGRLGTGIIGVVGEHVGLYFGGDEARYTPLEYLPPISM